MVTHAQKPAEPATSHQPSMRQPRIVKAMTKLAMEGKAAGTRSSKISVRVEPGVFAAAAERLGVPESQVSDVINASLAVAAAPDRFKVWWAEPGEPLPDDFERAI